MQVVILAGGLGTRLRPLTETVPKPMVPVGDRPFLSYMLDHLASQGFQRVLLLTGYLGEQIKDHFGDGSRYGLEIRYSREPRPIGTGGALRHALEQLEESFLILYGDSLLPIQYWPVVEDFRSRACRGLVVVYDNRPCDTGVPGNIAIDPSGYVTRYDKTSGSPDLNYVEAGVLCFRRDVFASIPQGEVTSLEQELYPGLISQRQLCAYVTRQRFFDIGTPGRLHEFTLRHACSFRERHFE